MESLNDIENDNLPGKTIHIYKKIYSAIFKYGFFVCVFILAILLFVHLSKKTVILDGDSKSYIEKDKLLQELNKEKTKISSPDISQKIIQGELKAQDNLIISINNIILYKGFVMPRSIVLYDDNKITKRENFKAGYNIDDLQYFIENIIFTDYKSTQEIEKEPLLKIKNNLKDTFFISCIEKPINFTCEYFLENFLDSFYIYDLSKDYKGLNNIFNQIKNTAYKDSFCDGMMKYISYAQDTSLELEGIASQCGDEFYKTFNATKSFLNIQNQLSEGYINATLSDDIDANAYKLISYQQILYNDVSESIINEARFNSYLNFIASLLKKEGSIDNIYLDITYWINNKYLIPTMNTIKYKLTENKKAEVNGIINNIEKINNGSRLDGYNGLETKITNESLKNVIIEEETGGDSTRDETQQLLNSIKNLSYIKVINEEISGNLIRISGYMKLKSEDDPLYFGANFENQGGNLVLIKIGIADYDELNNIINELLGNRNYNMMEIYEYIDNSIKLYSSTKQLSVCELISSKVEGAGGVMSECSPEKITIKNSDNINYRFKLGNYSIKSITVSDKTLEPIIQDLVQNVDIDVNMLPNTIEYIISYKPQENENNTDNGSVKNMIAAETLKQYLGAKIIDIQENDNGIYVIFTINDLKLGGIFNPTNNELSSLSFQEPYIQIKGFRLILSDGNLNNINNFISNPVKYIGNIDISAYNKFNNK